MEVPKVVEVDVHVPRENQKPREQFVRGAFGDGDGTEFRRGQVLNHF